MSSPYPPPPGGQQGPPSYGGPAPSSWGPAGPSYGPPGQGPGGPGMGAPGGPPGYGGYGGPGPGGPGGPGQGYGPGPGGGPSGGPGQYSSGPPKAPRKPVDLGRILPLIIAALGLLGFIFGFLRGLSVDSELGSSGGPSVYASQGHLPIWIAAVGLLALGAVVPKGAKYPLLTALFAIAGLLAAIGAITSGVSSYGAGYSRGAGLILLLIVALLQAAAAVYWWLTDSGTVKPAALKVGSSSGSSGGSGPGQSSSFGPGPSAGQGGPGQGGPGQVGPGQSSGQNDPRLQGFGGYGQGYQQPAPPDPSGYGSYQPSAYRPAGPQSDYNPYAPSQGDAPASEPGTGPTPTVDPPSYGRPPAEAAPGQPGQRPQHGQGDEPPPDVTQQVRF